MSDQLYVFVPTKGASGQNHLEPFTPNYEAAWEEWKKHNPGKEWLKMRMPVKWVVDAALKRRHEN